MAAISSKVVFTTTSPRTPLKMVPEIELLYTHFNGQPWNHQTQVAFMELLREKEFFFGEGANDPAFSARDRITRAPQTLGFVKLSPVIDLTPAGKALITSKRKEEIFLHQLLKFQLPSPYHRPSSKAADFRVKPYLEFFRLIRYFGTLKFDELMIFGLQLTDYHLFDRIVRKIETFRYEKIRNTGNYRKFRSLYLYNELKEIYREEISLGEIKTRENKARSVDLFLQTKAQNMRDYADACFRYLRATGLVNISHTGKSISIVPEKQTIVDHFLDTVDPNPCHTGNKTEYIAYLGNPELPALLTDDRNYIVNEINNEFPDLTVPRDATLSTLKDLLYSKVENRKETLIANQIAEIKDYRLYDDISNTFRMIKQNAVYDAPLILEWNTWRAATMLDGGNIVANLKFDDFGKPMSTAQGNMADIICDYGDFGVTIEVTMQTGQRQYETEGEPVARHLAKLKKESKKPAYCLFIAPTINEACIAHFYGLHKVNISYYGGYSTIVPLPLSVFEKMVEDSYKAFYTPGPESIRRFFEQSMKIAETSRDEKEWFQSLTECALHWLEDFAGD